MHLIVGNKLYSSWSLRAGILLNALEVPYEETVIAMYKPDTKTRMLSFGPTGLVPVVIDGDVAVWESLAIQEYLHEKFPDKHVFPKNVKARAFCRSICCEMHASFMAIRSSCPMNLTARFKPKPRDEAFLAEVARVENLWAQARSEFAGDGDFLFGEFGAADAMFAPMVTRLDTYQIEVSAETRAYMDAVLNHPAFLKWKKEAFEEPWFLPHYEEDETVETRYYLPQEGRS